MNGEKYAPEAVLRAWGNAAWQNGTAVLRLPGGHVIALELQEGQEALGYAVEEVLSLLHAGGQGCRAAPCRGEREHQVRGLSCQRSWVLLLAVHRQRERSAGVRGSWLGPLGRPGGGNSSARPELGARAVLGYCAKKMACWRKIGAAPHIWRDSACRKKIW